MRTRMSKLMIALVLMLSGAFLTAGPGTGCLSLGAESLLAEANLCFIINCQNGIFGGTIEPCPPIDNFSGESLLTPPTGPLFSDCPDLRGGP